MLKELTPHVYKSITHILKEKSLILDHQVKTY